MVCGTVRARNLGEVEHVAAGKGGGCRSGQVSGVGWKAADWCAVEAPESKRLGSCTQRNSPARVGGVGGVGVGVLAALVVPGRQAGQAGGVGGAAALQEGTSRT